MPGVQCKPHTTSARSGLEPERLPVGLFYLRLDRGGRLQRSQWDRGWILGGGANQVTKRSEDALDERNQVLNQPASMSGEGVGEVDKSIHENQSLSGGGGAYGVHAVLKH